MTLLGSQLVLTRAIEPSARERRGAPEQKTGDIDLKNILTLVPSEAVAPFLTAKLAAPAAFTPYVWVWICFAICLLICLGLRIKASQPEGMTGLDGVNWKLVIASGVAFFIWAQATTEEGLMVPIFHGSFAGLAAIAYGIVVPRFVPAAVIRT